MKLHLCEFLILCLFAFSSADEPRGTWSYSITEEIGKLKEKHQTNDVFLTSAVTKAGVQDLFNAAAEEERRVCL